MGQMIGVEFKMKRKAAGKAKQTVTIGAKKNNPHVERSSLPLKKVMNTLHSLMTTAWNTSPLSVTGSGRHWRKNISYTSVRLRTSLENKVPLAFTGIVHKPSFSCALLEKWSYLHSHFYCGCQNQEANTGSPVIPFMLTFSKAWVESSQQEKPCLSRKHS